MKIKARVILLTNIVNKSYIQSKLYNYNFILELPNGDILKICKSGFRIVNNEYEFKLLLCSFDEYPIRPFLDCFELELTFEEDTTPHIVLYRQNVKLTEEHKFAYAEWLKTTDDEEKSESYFYTFCMK